jgi:hypothetical protein
MSIHYQKKLVAKKYTCDYNFKGVLCAFTCWIQLQKIEHSIEFFFPQRKSTHVHECNINRRKYFNKKLIVHIFKTYTIIGFLN